MKYCVVCGKEYEPISSLQILCRSKDCKRKHNLKRMRDLHHLYKGKERPNKRPVKVEFSPLTAEQVEDALDNGKCIRHPDLPAKKHGLCANCAKSL